MANELTGKELATVLAALRLFQTRRPEGEAMVHFRALPGWPGHQPLNDEEIEELCERLNCD